MTALSTIVMPTHEEPISSEILLRHEIIVMKEPLDVTPPANCCAYN